MFLPAEYLWLEPVIIAAIVVFVISLFSNVIAFGSRFANALVTAILFAVVFGFLINWGYGDMTVTVDVEPDGQAQTEPAPAPVPAEEP
jgi:hypothetical protein